MTSGIQALVWGFMVGVPASALFFWGLGWGLQRALRGRRPGLMLAFSFFVRAALLLGLGVWLVRSQPSPWILAGYLLAFIMVRFITVRRARALLPPSAPDTGSAR